MQHPVLEGTVRTPRHTTHYLDCGPRDGPLLVFCHGWPELAMSWRHQLPALAALGLRCVAPDMRGYGRSSVHPDHADYALEQIVADMLELLDALGRERAVWVGHDWGSPVVWSHRQPPCRALPGGRQPLRALSAGGLRAAEPGRRWSTARTYPAAEFPAGQWDYQLLLRGEFRAAPSRSFEADRRRHRAAAVPRRQSGRARQAVAAPRRSARDGGWFGGAGRAPDLPRDERRAERGRPSPPMPRRSERNGFFGPDSWYMNHAANMAYAQRAPEGGRLGDAGALPARRLRR